MILKYAHSPNQINKEHTVVSSSDINRMKVTKIYGIFSFYKLLAINNATFLAAFTMYFKKINYCNNQCSAIKNIQKMKILTYIGFYIKGQFEK